MMMVLGFYPGNQNILKNPTYLWWFQVFAPFVYELGEHGERATAFNLAQTTKHGKLIVCHAHVNLKKRKNCFWLFFVILHKRGKKKKKKETNFICLDIVFGDRF